MMKYALTTAAGLALAANANAGTFGGWDWTLNDTAGGSGTVDMSGLSVTGGDAGSAGQTYFSTTAVGDQTVEFDWSYTSVDYGDFDFAFYIVNGATTTLAINDDSPASGTDSFSVSDGDTFGFGVETVDGVFGAGSLDVTSISPPIPTPGALTLFGVAGLAAARRRR